MAKKKLNKNVIAGLTVGAMFVFIVTVAIGSAAVSKKDPKILAAKAADFEKAADLKRAGDTFLRAYTIDKEAKYLVESARCYYNLGETGAAIELLRKAQAAAPNDATILNPVLERFWELKSLGWTDWALMQETAAALVQVEPDNFFARAFLGEALFMQRERDAANIEKSEEQFKRANELGATDPRVAMITARHMLDLENDAIKKTPTITAEEANRRRAEARKAAIVPLKASFAVNPKNAQLASTLSFFLRDAGEVAEAESVLKTAVAAIPDSYEVRTHLASLWVAQLVRGNDASNDDRLSRINEALEQINEAIRLEPAAFECYTIKTQLLELKSIADGSWETQRPERMKEILETLVRAQNDTLQLKSLRAAISSNARAEMFTSGFGIALRYFEGYSAPETRTVALEYARKFAELSRFQFPSRELGPMMEGWIAAVEGDSRRAIQLYKDAEKIAGSLRTPVLPFIKEQLALLQAKDAPGAALKYTDECLDFYFRQNLQPKRSLVYLKLDLLARLERYRDAYNFIEQIERGMKDDKRLLLAKARMMEALKIPGADELFKRIGDSPVILVEKARLAAVAKDFSTAIDLLSRYLADHPTDFGAVRLYALCVTRIDRREEGAKLMDALIEKAPDDATRSTLRSWRVLITETDPAVRDRKLVEIIESNPDECARASGLLDFYLQRGDYDKCTGPLEILEKCRGADDPDVMNVAFSVAFAKQDIETAEQLSVKLSRINADRAGGATYRGKVAVARGKIADALREFRLAERELPADPLIKASIADLLLKSTPPQFDEAIAVLKQGLEIDPRDFLVNKLLYICYESLGRESEGMPYLVTASEIQPDDEYVQQRIKLVEEANDPQKGVEWRESLRKEKPADVDNLLRLAEDYERLKQTDKADEIMTAAMAANPAAPRAAQWILQIDGNRKTPGGMRDPAARRIGEDFLRQHIDALSGPAKFDAKLVLGRFYEGFGDSANAVTTYRDAERSIEASFKDDPDTARRAKIIVNNALGEYYARNQQFADAIDAYRVALSQVKSDQGSMAREIRVNLVEAMLSGERFGDAAKELESFEKEFQNDYNAKMLRARWLLAQGSNEKTLTDAVALLTQALAIRADDVTALFGRAKINTVLRKYNDARDDLVKIKSINRKFYDGRLELARVYELMQSYDLAKTELVEILNDRLADSPEGGRAAAVDLISFLARIKRPVEAEAEISKFIARDPENSFWHYQMGRMLASRKEYSAAITPLTRAMDLTAGSDPDIIVAWLDTMTLANRAREAIDGFNRVKSESKTPKVRASAAGAYLKLQNAQKAVEELERALTDAANERVASADDVFARIVGYVGVNEALQLVRRCAKAVEGNKESEDRLKTILARVLVSRPDPAARTEGMAIADAVLAGKPGPKVDTTARLAKAAGLDAEGDTDGAIAIYESIVRDDPNNPAALNNLAFLLAERKNKPAEALPYAERAVRLNPRDINVLDTVGTVQMLNNNLRQAEAVLREAIRLDPDNIAATFHLGQTFARAGQAPEARQFFTRVLELTKGSESSDYRRRAEEEIAKLK